MNRYVSLLLVTLFTTSFAIEDFNRQCQNTRIVDGQDAPEGAFPFMASLRRSGNQHFCGGSIIGDRWILTAAHCLDGQYIESIVVGTNTLNKGGDKYYPEKIIIHPEWNTSELLNDLGLILLTDPIKFNKLAQPINLPTNDTDKHNYPATATGWGRLYSGGPLSNKLQFLRTCLKDKATCVREFPGSNMFHQICTYVNTGGVCNGDSGSPLIVDDLQVGIASYVVITCAQGYPDFFTRVATHLDWIKEVTNKY